jgi:hypothetical protein
MKIKKKKKAEVKQKLEVGFAMVALGSRSRRSDLVSLLIWWWFWFVIFCGFVHGYFGLWFTVVVDGWVCHWLWICRGLWVAIGVLGLPWVVGGCWGCGWLLGLWVCHWLWVCRGLWVIVGVVSLPCEVRFARELKKVSR